MLANRPLRAVPRDDGGCCVRGALMLGKQPIAVIDLGARLGLGAADGDADATTARGCIVVVSVSRADGRRYRAGFIVDGIVDGIGDVQVIPDERIEPLPDNGQFENDRFLRGTADDGNAGRVAILSVEHVLGVHAAEQPPAPAIETSATTPVARMRVVA